MKKHFLIPLALLSVLCTSCSCDGESLTKKAAKKSTEIALEAIEGVAEAVGEHGDKVGEKMADATGAVAQGAGRSFAKQLDEHAATVAAVAGRTLVQSADGLATGIKDEYYTALTTENNLCDGVSLDFIGLIKDKPIVDAYFLITKNGKYSCAFEFCSDKCSTVTVKKEVEAERIINERAYTVISFALNDSELALVKACKCIKATVKAI